MSKRVLDMFKSQSKKAAEDARKLNKSNIRWAESIAGCVVHKALDIDIRKRKIKVCVQSSLTPRDAGGMF